MKTLLATTIIACLALTPAAMATTIAKPATSGSGSGALIIERGAKPTGSISSSKSTSKKSTKAPSKRTKSTKSSKSSKTTAPATSGASPANLK